MLLIPVMYYLLWSVNYSFLNFVILQNRAKKLLRKTLYTELMTRPDIVKLLKSINVTPSPLTFMICHFIYFFVMHLLAIIMWHSYYINTLAFAFYLVCVIWNGA